MKAGRVVVLRVLMWGAALGLGLGFALFGAGAWVLNTTTGTGFVLNAIPALALRLGQSVEIEHGGGALAQGVVLSCLSWTDGKTRVLARDVQLQVALGGLLNSHLDVERLHAASVTVNLPPKDPNEPPFQMPDAIRLPVRIDLQSLQIGALVVDRLTFEQVKGSATAKAGGVTVHHLGLITEGANLQLNGQMKLAQPYAVDAVLNASRVFDDLHLDGRLLVGGSLQALDLNLTATGEDPRSLKASQAMTASAVVKPFGAVLLERIKLEAQGFNPHLWFDSAPRAVLDVEASLEPNPELTRSTGHLNVSNQNPLKWQDGGVPVRSVKSRFDLSLREQALFKARVDLDQLDFFVGSRPQGRVSAQMDWSASDGVAQKKSVLTWGDLTLVLKAEEVSTAPWVNLPMAQLVSLEGSVAKKAGLIQVPALQVKNRAEQSGAIPAQLDVMGEVDWAGLKPARMTVQFAQLNPAQYLRNASPLLRGLLNGVLSYEGTLQNAKGAWQPDGLLKTMVQQSTLAKAPIQWNAELQGGLERFSKVHAHLDWAGNRVKVDGSYGAAEDFLDLLIDADRLKDLAALTGQAVRGSARVKATLRGRGQGIFGAGQAEVQNFRLGDVVEVDALTGKFELGLQADSPWVADVTLRGLSLPDDTGRVMRRAGGKTVELPATQTIKTLTASLKGTRANHVLTGSVETGLTPFSSRRAVAAQWSLMGGLRQSPSVGSPQSVSLPKGTQGSPLQWSWAGQLQALSVEGLWRPLRSLKLEGPAALVLAPGLLELRDLRLRGEDQSLIHSELARLAGKQLSLRGKAPALALPQFSSLLKRPVSFEPKDLVANLSWRYEANPEQVDGHVELKRVSGGFRILEDAEIDVPVEKLDVVADFDRLSARLDVQMDASNFGRLTGNVKIPVFKNPETEAWQVAADQAMEGAVGASVSDLTWLGPLINSGLRTSGEGQLAVALGGSVNEPRVQGRLFARNVVLNQLDQGLRLEDGQLVLDFNSDRAKLEQLEFNVYNRQVPRNRLEELGSLVSGVGKVTGTGVWNLDGLGGEASLKLQRVGLVQRADRWVMMDGLISARQPKKEGDPVLVRGDLQALGGYIEIPEDEPQKLGADVVVRGRNAAGPGQSLPVDVALTGKLGEHFYLNAKGLRTRLTGGMNLLFQEGVSVGGSRSGRRLQAFGTIQAVDGTYRAYGQDLSIERGVVNFQGPLDNPGLNIRAVRKGVAVEAGVEITGSARRPVVTLVSEPAVPDAEKLSWMIIGRGSNSSDKEATLLLTAAAAIFGDDDDSATRRIARSLGIDDLGLSSGSLTAADSRAVGSKVAIAPGADKSASVLGADDPLLNQRIISLGKRINEDLYLSFEQSVTTAANIVKLTYQYSRRLSLIARGGADNAVDVLYQFSFD